MLGIHRDDVRKDSGASSAIRRELVRASVPTGPLREKGGLRRRALNHLNLTIPMETATPTLTPEQTQNDNSGDMTQAKPQQEHTWLLKLVGDWTFESSCPGEPGQEPQTFRGSEKVKALGDLWIVGEGEGEMPGGGSARMMITLGFDPKRNRYVGTWCGSMMTHLWVYEGERDASGRVLTLNAEGPSFTDPSKTAKYQDIIEVVSDDHRILRSRTQGEDGKWTQFMEAHYRRR